ncbi:cobyrinate a,c-diamide synthase [Aminipila butyrica]|uniref:Cobyrinate a,c-diamide synthase n=1 Tax=Aminipila butyrica TaxID=433296 RepID=A0A858BXQ7_9FIRM|nr:cobyrinate a,c-diamide synthase [Aminipila butyrica]QIB69494.1 cobyrinate a,c-diamide synthase [Aminipila butyrica]
METKILPRVIMGAPGSGSGKTTVVCAILQALLNKKKHVASFKCGPDYIDPMFHKEALGLSSRNLDLFFNDIETIRYLLAKNADSGDIAIIEGVMGYYDGMTGTSYEASSYDLAKRTETPAVLILDCKGKAISMLAELKGFKELEADSQIKGVILNRISPIIYEEIKPLLEERAGVKVLGYMPTLKECSLESRHLGLITAQEIGNLKKILDTLARQAAETIDLEGLLELAESAQPISFNRPTIVSGAKVRIGVARDKAFCFYYQDNLDLLEEMGAELCYFSPLTDEKLPEGLQGLYFGGGYPELYLKELEKNISIREHIKQVLEAGVPCMAECGGFMYLHQRVQDQQGQPYSMVGAIEGESYYVGKLVRFGYIQMTAEKSNLLCAEGMSLRGHEFHYWDSSNAGDCFHAQKPRRKRNWKCVIGNEQLYAGYPHVHFYSNLQGAERFVDTCRKSKTSS